MSSGSVFSETLQSITTTKLEELAKQRLSFESQHTTLLETASKEDDPLKRLSILVQGAKICLGVQSVNGRVSVSSTGNTGLETDLKNIDRFLEQARYDPSVSPKVLEDWEKSIRQYLSIQSAKYQYADLYGKLVTEWLTSEKTTPAPASGDVEMTEVFEDLPGAKKLETRIEWEKDVFEPAQINTEGLKAYLQSLFITAEKDTAKSISAFRKKLEQFEESISKPRQFTVSSLKWVIESLQTSDQLSSEKREVLRDFLSNDIILAEIADVLNMRMTALNRWGWGAQVPLEQRRKVNGGYTIQMQEDLLQAIFLHYIGVKWSEFFKKAFTDFRADSWKSTADISRIDRLRREYYLGPRGTEDYPSLRLRRTETYREDYFAHQLLNTHTQKIQNREGEEEAEMNAFEDLEVDEDEEEEGEIQPQAAGGLFGRKSKKELNQSIQFLREVDDEDDMIDYSDEYVRGGNKVKNPMQAKQNLLHLVSTEIVLNTHLHDELTCFRSVFESWNQLLPHDTILTVLEFLGVSEQWQAFFRTFLEAPLKFMDDPESEPRLRRRGTPGSHTLSHVFGEVVFACLDFSVYKATDGGELHRLYDDIWFWSNDYEKCAKAWASVTQFIDAMGVKLNKAKTGSVRVAKDPSTHLEIDERLPHGEIRWGFLCLDSATGRFDIDENMVNFHIKELRKQLEGKSKSVIDWIQAWNTYAATFISSNFGKAANCFGREHVDCMLSTHRRVQETIFDGGNVVQFLKKTIEERFEVKDIPDGFLFFPVELGGLDLKSPFVNLLQIRESVQENPHDAMHDYFEAEREDYAKAKLQFDKQRASGNIFTQNTKDFKPDQPDTFFPFEEYIRYRETLRPFGQANLIGMYDELRKHPVEESIDVSVQILQEVEKLMDQDNLSGITGNWYGMEAYWKWIAQMYGPEMTTRFGGLNVVDPGLLPVGMVSMFRQKRIKWQG